MKLMPWLSASLMTAWVAGWSMAHWWKSGKTLPKLMPPMQMRLISMSVWPSFVYSMGSLSLCLHPVYGRVLSMRNASCNDFAMQNTYKSAGKLLCSGKGNADSPCVPGPVLRRRCQEYAKLPMDRMELPLWQRREGGEACEALAGTHGGNNRTCLPRGPCFLFRCARQLLSPLHRTGTSRQALHREDAEGIGEAGWPLCHPPSC